MFCGPETVDSRGSTKHTAFLRSQTISILLQLFADECAARRIFDEVLLCQRNVETGQTQRWAGSNATFANAQN